MQPYLGLERGRKEANCGNGSHIEAVVKEVEVEITNSARPCSVKHLSSLTGLPNKQSELLSPLYKTNVLVFLSYLLMNMLAKTRLQRL